MISINIYIFKYGVEVVLCVNAFWLIDRHSNEKYGWIMNF